MLWLPWFVYHYVISTRGLPAHILQEMASYIVFVVDAYKRGDAYSEAKSITELCALAHSLVVSQYITRFPVVVPICLYVVAFGYTIWFPAHGFQPTASSPWFPAHSFQPMVSSPQHPAHGFQPMASSPWFHKYYVITSTNEVSQGDDIIVSWAGFVNIMSSHRRTKCADVMV